MKKTYLFIFILLGAVSAKATVHTVTCQNTPSHFLPVTLNAVCGDTIHWTWVAGTHVVGPIAASDIPAGAAMWSAPIDAGNHSFEYVVKIAGNYHYVCHPSTPHGEDAYIVVSAATGVIAYNVNSNLQAAYPNPFSAHISIPAAGAERVLIYNALGENILSFGPKKGALVIDADLSGFPDGIYFYTILKEGALPQTRKIVKTR